MQNVFQFIPITSKIIWVYKLLLAQTCKLKTLNT
jgi:hypothetical protein